MQIDPRVYNFARNYVYLSILGWPGGSVDQLRQTEVDQLNIHCLLSGGLVLFNLVVSFLPCFGRSSIGRDKVQRPTCLSVWTAWVSCATRTSFVMTILHSRGFNGFDSPDSINSVWSQALMCSSEKVRFDIFMPANNWLQVVSSITCLICMTKRMKFVTHLAVT